MKVGGRPWRSIQINVFPHFSKHVVLLVNQINLVKCQEVLIRNESIGIKLELVTCHILRIVWIVMLRKSFFITI